uniref:Uncharacterized protein n=1 Tax=Lotus japonicus TaxID=34305 RepID=I3S149_LOTJA|nr:unknown [Lotus japonicus]
MSGINDIGLDLEVDGNEISRVCVVSMDAANFGSSYNDKLRLRSCKEGFNISLASQIKLRMRSQDYISEPKLGKPTNNGRANKTPVASHENLSRFVS